MIFRRSSPAPPLRRDCAITSLAARCWSATTVVESSDASRIVCLLRYQCDDSSSQGSGAACLHEADETGRRRDSTRVVPDQQRAAKDVIADNLCRQERSLDSTCGRSCPEILPAGRKGAIAIAARA